jgi:flagellar operon protein
VSDPIRHNPAITPPGVGGPARPAPARPGTNQPLVPFDSVLRGTIEGAQDVRLSGHAIERLQRRGIDFDQVMSQRLNDGVNRAAAKGSRDALVLVDGTAFVVSVANKTVITAVDPSSMKDRVFTNIDSAVIS